MKKIIDGRLYSTSTARILGEWSNDLPPSNFRYHAKTLYQTPRGVYFMHERGGYLSSMRDSEQIVVLSKFDARMFVETYLTADVYDAAFGEVEEA